MRGLTGALLRFPLLTHSCRASGGLRSSGGGDSVAREWELLNSYSGVGRRTLGTVVIFLSGISADINVNVEESSYGIDEEEGLANGGFVGE